MKKWLDLCIYTISYDIPLIKNLRCVNASINVSIFAYNNALTLKDRHIRIVTLITKFSIILLIKNFRTTQLWLWNRCVDHNILLMNLLYKIIICTKLLKTVSTMSKESIRTFTFAISYDERNARNLFKNLFNEKEIWRLH